MFTIFRTLLAIIHLVYSLYQAFSCCWLIVRRKCTELLRQRRYSRTDVEMIVKSIRKKNTLPRHLVIILGQDEKSFVDCIRIIGWCITLGIPYISFYDRNGFLVEHKEEVEAELAKQRPDLVEHIIWDPTSSTKNGYSNPKTHVLLLSYKDGKGEIVSLTQAFAKAVITGSLKPEEVNSEMLHEKLKLRGAPDPDLALISGNVCCTYGLLPWQTRQTEFLMLPQYINLSINDFLALLDRYGNCEKRYGK